MREIGGRRNSFPLFDFETVVFDDGVAEDFVAGFVDLFAPGFFVGIGEFDFEVFSDVDGADAFVTHVLQGALDGLPLGVHDGLFWSDDYFCFHFLRPQAGRLHVKARTIKRQIFLAVP
jgi:hypothetical protein